MANKCTRKICMISVLQTMIRCYLLLVFKLHLVLRWFTVITVMLANFLQIYFVMAEGVDSGPSAAQ